MIIDELKKKMVSDLEELEMKFNNNNSSSSNNNPVTNNNNNTNRNSVNSSLKNMKSIKD